MSRYALLRTPLWRTELRRHAVRLVWALQSRVAGVWRATGARSVRVVAVVGTYGKTTTARAIATVLGADEKHRHPAHAVTKLRPGDRHAVLEVGIHRRGQMARYAAFVRPQVVVVTCIGSEHSRTLGTVDATRAEKAAMVRALPSSGLAVLNGDDANVRWMASQTAATVTTFGFDATNDVRATDVAIDGWNGTRFVLHADGEERAVHVRLIGRHLLYPIFAAIAVALAEGVGLDDALARLEPLAPGSNRLEPAELPNGALLLRDHCKSSLETIDAALDALAEMPARRKIVVLGDVEDPPGHTLEEVEATYKRIGKRVGSIATRAVFVNVDVGGDRPRYTAGAVEGGLSPETFVEVSTVRDAVAALVADLSPGDVVLLEGSAQQHFDRIALALAGIRVGCEIPVCTAWMHCADCPMLESGWKDPAMIPVRVRA